VQPSLETFVEFRMNHGSLFSGIGGFDLPAERMGWNNSFHCEIDPWNQKLLHQHFPNSVQYGDITTTDFSIWRGRIDVLTGGFPCQDASNGKSFGEGQKGLEGARTGLYWHMLRAIKEIQPRIVVAENVSNIIKINGGRDFYRILKSLSEIGYDAEWDCFTASQFGAPHHRERVYLVAYARDLGLSEGEHVLSTVVQAASPERRDIAGATVQVGGAWDVEPPLYRMDDGFSAKLDKDYYHSVKGVGNAVLPQIPFSIFKSLARFLSPV